MAKRRGQTIELWREKPGRTPWAVMISRGLLVGARGPLLETDLLERKPLRWEFNHDPAWLRAFARKAFTYSPWPSHRYLAQRAYRMRMVARGLCPHCGKPATGGYECLERQARKRQLSAAKGLGNLGVRPAGSPPDRP